MRFSWSLLLLFLWGYRSLYSYVGQAVVANLTTLGDSSKFQRAELTERGINLAAAATDVIGVRSVSTVLTEYIGAGFARIFFGSPVLVNIGFQTIAFVGIAAFLMSLRPQHRLIAAGFIVLPSFTLWSSIASKEAIVVFAVGLICAHVVKQLRREKRSLLLLMIGLGVIAIYKNHYIPALLFTIVGIAVARHVRQAHFLALLGIVVSMVPLYFLKDRLAAQALAILPHFLNVGDVGGRLTREAFWQSPDEVFLKAAEGMALSFFGPTLEEARVGLLQAASFMESSFLVGALLIIAFWRLPRVPLFFLFLGLGTVFWILFANYPFGVMNAGGAIRYRTGYELIVILVIVVIFSRHTYLAWRLPSVRVAGPEAHRPAISSGAVP